MEKVKATVEGREAGEVRQDADNGVRFWFPTKQQVK